MKATTDSHLARARAAAAALSSKLPYQPRVAIILGSGLSDVLGPLQTDVVTSTAELLGSPSASVAGHSGKVVAGRLAGVPVMAFLGRIHLYEGHTPDEQTLPALLSALLGARILILTNASGGINPAMAPGDLMLISDQINLTGKTVLPPPGQSVMRGDREVYDAQLTALLERAALSAGVKVHHGVYAGGLGPSYETAAEIRMLKRIGADAVGMSTVLEALAGRRLGMRVAGISVITNLATGISTGRLSHDDVTAGAAGASEKLRAILTQALAQIASEDIAPDNFRR